MVGLNLIMLLNRTPEKFHICPVLIYEALPVLVLQIISVRDKFELVLHPIAWWKVACADNVAS